jgi:hypothetical protein
MKDLIVKSLEYFIDHHLQAHIHCKISSAYITYKLHWRPTLAGKYKWIFTKVWRHCIARGGQLARSANKEKICVTLHETCGNETLWFLTNKSVGWLNMTIWRHQWLSYMQFGDVLYRV